MRCAAANTLWLAGSVAEFARFHRATARVREEQADVLGHLLAVNANTEFGLRHGFAAIRTVREYQRRVPLRSYEDYERWIGRVSAGCPRVLTRERVRLLEPTSGSTGAVKLIPYTASLQSEFTRGIRAWVADLFLHRPDLMRGRAYWSVSPVAGAASRSSGGIPIGFEDDSAYVGRWQRPLVRAAMAVPPAVRHLADMEAFRYETLLALIRCGDLRVISVWNPTFLSVLVQRLGEWGDRLARDVRHIRRTDVLRRALKARSSAECHATLWPRLGVVSCWADANAAPSAAQLSALFPQARVQNKGLIATEGFVSLPVTGHHGSALAIRGHFFEFAPVDSDDHLGDGPPRLAHELDEGQRYAVILSTGGGLYRYHMHDVVEVVGRLRRCPLIRFIGRRRRVSDWFGEKLNETYVARGMHAAFAASALQTPFAMLACDRTLDRAAYVLYVETAAADAELVRVAERIEAHLRCSYHYDYARRLGQLGALRVFRARGAGERYFTFAVGAGQRAGGIKPVALDPRDGWSQRFPGEFVSDRTAAEIPPLSVLDPPNR